MFITDRSTLLCVLEAKLNGTQKMHPSYYVNPSQHQQLTMSLQQFLPTYSAEEPLFLPLNIEDNKAHIFFIIKFQECATD